MSHTVDQLIERMERAAANGLPELVESGDGWRIRLVRDADQTGAGTQSPAAPLSDPHETEDASKALIISAPYAGLCHLASEPGAAPFIRPGDRIEIGQTMCVIEAMKVMVGIPAEISGIVDAVLVADGEMVEAQTPLVRVRA